MLSVPVRKNTIKNKTTEPRRDERKIDQMLTNIMVTGTVGEERFISITDVILRIERILKLFLPKFNDKERRRQN